VGTKRYYCRTIRTLSACLAMVFVLMLSAPFVFADDEVSIKDLEGKTIGVQTGSIFDKYVEEAIPGVKVEYFSTFTDEVNALRAKKIDGFSTTETSMDQLMKQESGITTA